MDFTLPTLRYRQSLTQFRAAKINLAVTWGGGAKRCTIEHCKVLLTAQLTASGGNPAEPPRHSGGRRSP
jgi:hypothetical protein